MPDFPGPAGDSLMNSVMPLKLKALEQYHKEGLMEPVPSAAAATCSGGFAGEYPCRNIDLEAFISLADLGPNNNGREGNDIWGWTDPSTGKEYAISCVNDGTSYVDISNPSQPIVLGFLATHTVSSSWRDVKVYNNYAFIVSEARNHGMQIFDLTQLRNVANPSRNNLFEETAFYGGFGSAHNIAINEASGFAYSVGTQTCQGGLHIVNIQNPLNPTCAGCFWQDSYVHDTQCVNYNGPDPKYIGQEICFCFNEDTLTIVDVTDKLNMVQISRTPYQGSQYTHQGWLSSSGSYLFLNDELDERYGTAGRQGQTCNTLNPCTFTRTLIWNVQTLASPSWVNSYLSSERSIDHNLYVNGEFVYESNYCAGLRILRIVNENPQNVVEVAYFDVAPDCTTTEFLGTWSNYPYFKSGIVAVNSIERGLFILSPSL